MLDSESCRLHSDSNASCFDDGLVGCEKVKSSVSHTGCFANRRTSHHLTEPFSEIKRLQNMHLHKRPKQIPSRWCRAGDGNRSGYREDQSICQELESACHTNGRWKAQCFRPVNNFFHQCLRSQLDYTAFDLGLVPVMRKRESSSLRLTSF